MGDVSLGLDTADMIVRVAVAGGLAGLIGVEREISGQPAGFRTHIVLALGAALFGLISIHAFEPFTSARSGTNVQVDVTRVASQVVVGIGFLGAGSILKQGASIRGLTTAASLWVTTAIGLAAGVGYFSGAIAVTVATLVSLFGLRGVRRIIRGRLAGERASVTVRLAPGADPAAIVASLRGLEAVALHSLQIQRDEESRSLAITIVVEGLSTEALEQSLAPLADRDDVEEVVLP